MIRKIWAHIAWLGLLLAFVPAAQAQFDRDWKIFVVPFSHEDVGFTASVETVIQQQSTYLDSVVAYVERYKSNPEDERFRWSTEVTWPLENYLETRSPEQIDHLMDLVREGYIDIGAFYLSVQTDLCGPEELVRSLYPANDIASRYGVPAGPAVINDTPGFTWSLAQLLDKAEVPYLSLAMNSGLSSFYDTTDLPFLFYWEGQSGHRTLVWRSMDPNWAYLEGAFVWAVYGSYSGTGGMENRITNLLNNLAEAGYPYDFVLINAGTGDNGPPRPGIVDNVRMWNENHSGSTMRVATFSDFFRHVARSGVADQIPVYSGDAPNWWSLWFASSATKGHLRSRKAQALLPAAETAASIASVVDPSFDYPDEALDRAYLDNLLYEDHNMGYKTTEPAPNEAFWELKMGWVTDALETGRNVLASSLDAWAGQIQTSGSLEIAVFNLLPWTRSEVVRVPVDDPLLEQVRAFEIVDNGTGRAVPHQRLSTGEVAFRADSVPSLGYKTFRIAENTGPITAPTPLSGTVLENESYRVEVGETGGALSVFDKDLVREWAIGDGRLNQYRYTGSGVPALAVTSSDSGEVLQRIFLEGDAPGSDSYQTEVVLPAGLKRIDFFNTYDKNPPVGSETVDFVFDFDAPTSSLRYEIPFGDVRLFEDELSGFRIKHYESRRWSSVSDESGTAVLASDGPGMHAYPGGFQGKIRLLTSWDSGGSYRAGTGPLDADFSLTTHAGPHDPEFATRAGYDFVVPLSARVLPRNQAGMLDADKYSFIDVRGATVQLSTLKRWHYGDGLVGRFYNPSPEPVDVEFDINGLEPYVYEADLLERVFVAVKRGGSVRLSFGPHEVKTVVLGVHIQGQAETDRFEGPDPVLERPYPNPFADAVNLSYGTAKPAEVELTVHDVLGRRVATVFDGLVGPGRHEMRWNGRAANGVEVGAGVYVVRLEMNDLKGSHRRASVTVVKVR